MPSNQVINFFTLLLPPCMTMYFCMCIFQKWKSNFVVLFWIELDLEECPFLFHMVLLIRFTCRISLRIENDLLLSHILPSWCKISQYQYSVQTIYLSSHAPSCTLDKHTNSVLHFGWIRIIKHNKSWKLMTNNLHCRNPFRVSKLIL